MPRFLSLSLVPTLLPIGHERDSVRRAPVVTLGIIAGCTLVLLLCQAASIPTAEEKAGFERETMGCRGSTTATG